MGLDDPVIEIGITPNRSDCAGVRGIARDLAAAGLGRLKPLDPAPKIRAASTAPSSGSATCRRTRPRPAPSSPGASSAA